MTLILQLALQKKKKTTSWRLNSILKSEFIMANLQRQEARLYQNTFKSKSRQFLKYSQKL